jgi:hypothetical protein
VRKPGTVFTCKQFKLVSDDTFLRITLPTGRVISYPFPRLEAGKFGNAMVVFKDTAGGKFVDCRFGQGAYGGLWTENIVQAVARDLLAAAMLRLEAAGYPIVLHVHDEVVAEVPDGFGSVEEFKRLIAILPDWAAGLPIAAKAREGQRFSKTDAAASAGDDATPQGSAPSSDAPAGAEGDEDAEKASDDRDERGDTEETVAPGVDADDHRDSAGDPLSGGPGKIKEIYYYPTEKGEKHHRKFRTTTKKFWQEKWDGKAWVNGSPDIQFPYNVAALLAAPLDQAVWVTEGEKDANTLAALGLLVITNPGGGGKWNTDFTREQTERWFKGRRLVYLLEDNDANGRKHVDIIAKALHGLVGEVRVIRFRELEAKADVSDWLALGHTKAELLARAEAAPKWEPDALDVVCAADIEMRELTWVWSGRFAVGKVGLLAGLPDEGKGQILCYIAAQITTGGKWPCGEGAAPKGSVILLTAEDDLQDTVIPRLAAAGADLGKVHIVKMVRQSAGKGERMFSLVDDLELLRRKITEIGDVVMVQIDPVSAYLGVGKVDSFRSTDVRAVLAPLVQLAAELRIAVLGILHFNRDQRAPAHIRQSGLRRHRPAGLCLHQ